MKLPKDWGNSVLMMKATIKACIKGKSITVEIDTGCPVFLMSTGFIINHNLHFRLRKYDKRLVTATGQPIKILGCCFVSLQINNGSFKVNLVVFEGSSSAPLLGTEALDIIYPTWRSSFGVNQLSSIVENKLLTNVEKLKSKMLHRLKTDFRELVNNDLSVPIKNIRVNLNLKEGAIPVFSKARPVPFRAREKVDEELQGQVKLGILEPVEDSKWASPIVLVKKPDGGLRICIDPKRSLNPRIEGDHYKTTPVDELLVELGGHAFYSKIDLKGAFTQLELEEASRNLVTINTHRGLFRYCRLPFGVKTATAVFQRAMDGILRDLKGVRAFVDDVIVVADSPEEMEVRLLDLFGRLLDYGVKVNLPKCEFFLEEIQYLGHLISRRGIAQIPSRKEIIARAKVPSNVKELQSFLGLVTYSQKFVPKMANLLNPLYHLLKKEVKFVWTEECQHAFEEAKKSLCSDRFLIHFDPKKEIVISTDASDVGISAVLSHPHGVEGHKLLEPVWFSARTLTEAERKYPVLHRELLAIVFATEKYYQFVYDAKVVIYTDHEPLISIVRNGISLAITTSRVDRYLHRISPFDLDVRYKQGKLNCMADFGSRYPIDDSRSEADVFEENESLVVNFVAEGQSLNIDLLREYSKSDEVFVKLRRAIESGSFPKELKEFSSIRNELVINGELITYSGRVLIPRRLQEQVLQMLHAKHIGVVRMKQLARRYVYWPGVNVQIERLSKGCVACKEYNADTAKKVHVPWPKPSKPFDRVHVDFFYLEGRDFLILTDAYSRWVEVFHMTEKDAAAVGAVLTKVFSVFGDARSLVADNGPPFTSYEFEKFLKDRSIQLLHSAPYNPQSNGSAERWVATVKKMLKKNSVGGSREKLREVLFTLRNTPTTDGGLVPSEMMFSFTPRTSLSKLIPTEKNPVIREEIPKFRKFEIGEQAFLASQDGKRLMVKILEKSGQVNYRVVGEQVRERWAHANQLLKFEGDVLPSARKESEKVFMSERKLRDRNLIKKPSRF